MNKKNEIVLRLTHDQFQVVFAHLQAGQHFVVNEALTEIITQVTRQLLSPEQLAQAEADAIAKAVGSSQPNIEDLGPRLAYSRPDGEMEESDVAESVRVN